MVTAYAEPEEIIRSYTPLGACRDLFMLRSKELLIAGPAGTGKSLSCLQKLNACALKYSGMRGLILRKTRTSLTQSALVTFDKEIDPFVHGVRFHGQRQEYQYPNGSIVAVAGLDKDIKIMSTQFDFAYVQEATELTLEDWEALTTRLRNNVMPYQQLLADCNPSAPTHWLNQRCNAGITKMLYSKHTDNPTITESYLETLRSLSGVRKLRLYEGIWAAAEGLVYTEFDHAIHVIPRFDVPKTWDRYWVIDFGFTNPFCFQVWAKDGDGRLYRIAEIYQTQRIVEDHAQVIKSWQLRNDEPNPRAIICDHDAEDRATLERKLHLTTKAAKKSISPGIQAVQERLRIAGDKKPRIFFLSDSLIETDQVLVNRHKPYNTEQEFDGYVWDLAQGKKKGEVPIDADNHGMDCTRYMVMELDGRAIGRFTFV